MSNENVISAHIREVQGKGASRRLRRLDGLVPAILYGNNIDPQMVSIEHKTIVKLATKEGLFSHIYTLDLDGKKIDVIIKDAQVHPFKKQVLHVDFLRISSKTEIVVNVPLHFINEATNVGVKQQGGSLIHETTEIEISCLPKNLPEFIEVDVQQLALGESIHLSDITLPTGVVSTLLNQEGEHDMLLIRVAAPTKAEDDDGAEDAGAATEEPVS